MYRPIRLIARGGMGKVYEGRMELSLERELPCAIKLIRPELCDNPAHQEMFAREAETALTLNHPRLVRAHDFGTAPDGRLFLVMELIRGPNLEEAFELLRGVWPLHRRIARDMLAALKELHARGIAHRDISPRNILLDSAGRAVLADLGIVRRATGSGPEGVHGVAAYQSPEVLRGLDGTPESDLYSLGAVLFTMATGEPPFGRGEAHEVYARMTGALPEFPAEVPDDVAELIDELLAHEPEDRPTVNAALRSLGAWDAAIFGEDAEAGETDETSKAGEDGDADDAGEAGDHVARDADEAGDAGDSGKAGDHVASDAELAPPVAAWLDARSQTPGEGLPDGTPLDLRGAVLRFGAAKQQGEPADASDEEPAPERHEPPASAASSRRPWLLGLAAAAALGLALVAHSLWPRSETRSPVRAEPGGLGAEPVAGSPRPDAPEPVETTVEPGTQTTNDHATTPGRAPRAEAPLPRAQPAPTTAPAPTPASAAMPPQPPRTRAGRTRARPRRANADLTPAPPGPPDRTHVGIHQAPRVTSSKWHAYNANTPRTRPE